MKNKFKKNCFKENAWKNKEISSSIFMYLNQNFADKIYIMRMFG
jgi:hypothetical protein